MAHNGKGGGQSPQAAAAQLTSLVNAALGAHGSGRFADAAAGYRTILRQWPDIPAVHANLGDALAQLGHHDQAIASYRAALTRQPEAADTWGNLGASLSRLGRTDEAGSAFQRAVQLSPDHAPFHANLGTALLRQDAVAEAARAYDRAIALDPASPDAHYGLGCALSRLNRPEDAEMAFRRTIALLPEWSDGHFALANELYKAGRPDESVAAFRRAAELAPGNPAILAGLGQVLLSIGSEDAALAAFDSAVAEQAETPDVLFSIAMGMQACGQTDRAMRIYRDGIRRFPDDASLWSGLAETVASGSGDDPATADLLVSLLEHRCVRALDLREAVLSVLRRDPVLAGLLAVEPVTDPGAIAVTLAGNRLLLAALTSLPLCDVGFERLLTDLRRALLGETLPPAAFPFVVALASQCWLTEYVWEESENERSRMEALTDRKGTTIAVMAAYRPVDEAAAATHPELAELVRLQITQPEEERRVAPAIPCLTGLAGSVSAAVQAHPFPRWIRPGLAAKPVSLADLCKCIPARPTPPPVNRPLEILIAGCGTGQHALNSASAYANSRVLAVDLSRASLAYAQRQAQAFGIGNIEFAQADLLEMGSIDRRFDVIECLGVLHHLADPLAGWRVLTGLLRENGLMRIGLYSAAARSAVTAARALIAERGYPPTLAGIRHCRQELLALPDGHPARPVIQMHDFFTASGCRDLLFHVQEHQLTLPDIAAALGELDLTFLGFTDERVTAAFKSRFGRAADPLSLADWHTFETEHPETFLAMYQFWVGKNETGQ